MIKILFLGADPTNAARLRLGEEAREIREKLQLARERDQFSYEERWAVRPQDMMQAMLDTDPVVVHFSGHGSGQGGLCFEDNTGKAKLVPAVALTALFAQFRERVKCVVLNACYAEEQAKAIVSEIDFVVGMNDAVEDTAAIAFAVGFYQALGAGRTVTQAFEMGKVQILMQGATGGDIPVLYTRQGATATVPLTASETPQPTPATAPEQPNTPRKVDRTKLIDILDGLPEATLTKVISRIDGAGQHDNSNWLPARRIQSLLEFAESVIGPGLGAVGEAVVKVAPHTNPFA